MEELRLKLITAINDANLAPEPLLFVIKDVYRDVLDAYNRWLVMKDQPESEKVDTEIIE